MKKLQVLALILVSGIFSPPFLSLLFAQVSNEIDTRTDNLQPSASFKVNHLQQEIDQLSEDITFLTLILNDMEFELADKIKEKEALQEKIKILEVGGNPFFINLMSSTAMAETIQLEEVSISTATQKDILAVEEATETLSFYLDKLKMEYEHHLIITESGNLYYELFETEFSGIDEYFMEDFQVEDIEDINEYESIRAAIDNLISSTNRALIEPSTDVIDALPHKAMRVSRRARAGANNFISFSANMKRASRHVEKAADSLTSAAKALQSRLWWEEEAWVLF